MAFDIDNALKCCQEIIVRRTKMYADIVTVMTISDDEKEFQQNFTDLGMRYEKKLAHINKSIPHAATYDYENIRNSALIEYFIHAREFFAVDDSEDKFNQVCDILDSIKIELPDSEILKRFELKCEPTLVRRDVWKSLKFYLAD